MPLPHLLRWAGTPETYRQAVFESFCRAKLAARRKPPRR